MSCSIFRINKGRDTIDGTRVIPKNKTEFEIENELVVELLERISNRKNVIIGAGVIQDVMIENDRIVKDQLLKYNTMITNGIIKDFDILKRKKKTKNGITTLYIKLAAEIGQLEGEIDAGFKIKSDISSLQITSGDRVNLSYSTTRDSYITVVYIRDKEVQILSPSFGKKYEITDRDKECNRSFYATLSEENNSEWGKIKLIATEDEVDFRHNAMYDDETSTYKIHLSGFMNDLLSIPLNKIAINQIVFEISK